MSVLDQNIDQNTEDLSCLMDGELPDSKAKFLLRRLAHDDHLLGQWERWHEVRSALTDRRCALSGFSARVAQAIDEEPAVEISVAAAGKRPFSAATLFKPLAGLGVAAAVAAVAISLVPGQVEEVAPNALVGNGALEEIALVQDATPIREVANSARSASSGYVQPLLVQEYLFRHNEVSSTRSGQGLVPYIYVSSPNGKGSWQPLKRLDATQSAPDNQSNTP